jgi:hypothetical protein
MSQRISVEITQTRPGSRANIRCRAWPFAEQYAFQVVDNRTMELPAVVWDRGVLSCVARAIQSALEEMGDDQPPLPY